MDLLHRPRHPIRVACVHFATGGLQTLRDLATEGAATGHFDRDNMHWVMHSSYGAVRSRATIMGSLPSLLYCYSRPLDYLHRLELTAH
jgi:hypothetical protein